MRFAFRVAAAVGAVLIAAAPAHAGTVESFNGVVQVNRGGGFQQVGVGTVVNPGDRVLIGEGSNVRISHSNNCILVLPQQGLYTVPQNAPCTAASPPSVGPAEIGVGLAVAGGIGATVYLLTQDKKGSP